jgi:putative pyruvate formate lyase activating enzyme
LCGAAAGATVAAATAHFGEEPEVSGTRGSGTVFFRGCNMACRYCQNHEISQGPVDAAHPDAPGAIAAAMLDLAARGCHNVNWVTPSHVVPFAAEALAIARDRGLKLPVVYNTSGYDGLEALRLLDGLVDVYLPDLRYSDDATAVEMSGAPGYVAASRAAVMEMARQVGIDNEPGPDGTIRRGLIVRVLVLPNDLAGVRDTLRFLRDAVGTRVRLALMAQYFPTHRAASEPLLSRPAHHGEYARALDVAERLGFDNVLVQDLAASDFYRPGFDAGPEPFADAAVFLEGREPAS